MKILITGITGFVGSHLAEFLLSKTDQNFEIFGTVRWRSNLENVSDFVKKVKLKECDIRDFVSVYHLIQDVKPDRIFHLAAQSFVPISWSAPTETISTNISGQLNLLEAVRKVGINPRIQIAGSSEEYGLVKPDEVPIKETNPLRPMSPYAVSKIGQDMLAYQYCCSYGLHIVRTRAFNHTGPKRGEVFVASNFAKQIAMIENGLKEPVLSVGNLEAKRDFADVRDTVVAYWLSLEHCKPGEVYNICSGKSIKIRDLLDMLLKFSTVKVKLEVDRNRLRPSDVPNLLGDATRFKEATGWEPKIPLEQTMNDLLNYWRKKYERELQMSSI